MNFIATVVFSLPFSITNAVGKSTIELNNIP